MFHVFRGSVFYSKPIFKTAILIYDNQLEPTCTYTFETCPDASLEFVIGSAKIGQANVQPQFIWAKGGVPRWLGVLIIHC